MWWRTQVSVEYRRPFTAWSSSTCRYVCHFGLSQLHMFCEGIFFDCSRLTLSCIAEDLSHHRLGRSRLFCCRRVAGRRRVRHSAMVPTSNCQAFVLWQGSQSWKKEKRHNLRFDLLVRFDLDSAIVHGYLWYEHGMIHFSPKLCFGQ